MFTHIFDKDLDILLTKISNKEPFAFARYADGELAVLKNHHITGCDGWSINSEDKPFSEELKLSLAHNEPNYFYGISCPCCDDPSYKYLKSILQDRFDKVTFSNLFVNSNWKKSYDYFMSIKDKIFICNSSSRISDNFYKVPTNVLAAYRSNSQQLKDYYLSIARNHTNTLFCISAGPLAELIIHWMYCENPINQYVDIGSCLDTYIHNRETRSYQHQNSAYNLKTCLFNV